MLVRSYWDDIRLGKQEFPKGVAVEVTDTGDRMIRAAIRGGLLQVIAPPIVRVTPAGVPRQVNKPSTPSTPVQR